MIIKNADVFNEKGFFEKRDVYIDDELFSEKSKDLNVLDGSNCYLIPGLTDIHFHGCMGYDFCDGNK